MLVKQARKCHGGWQNSALVIALVLCCLVHAGSQVSGQESELPTRQEIAESISKLRADSMNVQGEFKVYRIEKPIPQAFEKSPEQLGIPLVRQGVLWRNSERFRTEFTSFKNVDGETEETAKAFAYDEEFVYRFGGSGRPDAGSLHIYTYHAPGVEAVRGSMDLVLWPLDALWSSGGVGFDEMIQRPDVEITSREDCAFCTEYSDGTDYGRCEFAPSKNYPLVRAFASTTQNDVDFSLDIRVKSVEKQGSIVPKKIVAIESRLPGTGGYTQIIEFDLEPLQANSPVAEKIAEDSFRHLGHDYRVYRYTDSERADITAHHLRQVDSERPNATFRKYFLWINGAIILAIIGYVGFRLWKKRQHAS